MLDLLDQAFALVCGQNPAHTWSSGGIALPLCQRCTGLYAGAALGFVLHLALRPGPTPRFLRIHGAFLLQMAPVGFGLVPQGPWLKAASAAAFALGLVAFLWLPLGSAGPRDPGKGPAPAAIHFVSAALGIAAILGFAWAGLTYASAGPAVASALSATGAAGLLALVGLALADIAVLAARTFPALGSSRRGSSP